MIDLSFLMRKHFDIRFKTVTFGRFFPGIVNHYGNSYMRFEVQINEGSNIELALRGKMNLNLNYLVNITVDEETALAVNFKNT